MPLQQHLAWRAAILSHLSCAYLSALTYLRTNYSTFTVLCPTYVPVLARTLTAPSVTCAFTTVPYVTCALNKTRDLCSKFSTFTNRTLITAPHPSPLALCALLMLPRAFLLSASESFPVDRVNARRCEETSSGSGGFKRATVSPFSGDVRDRT